MEQICITGGEGDLARHIADAFAAVGDFVSAPGRKDLDVTSAESVRRWFDAHPVPDLLVLNAGLAENQLLARCSIDSWERQMDANLHGAFLCAKAASRSMVKARRGHLIFISSQAAHSPAPGQAAYAAAKAALHGFAKSLARELGSANIRANVVLPGFLPTRMTADLPDSRLAEVTADHALGRLNSPEAVASFLVHLHRHLPHTSGQTFQLDSRPS